MVHFSSSCESYESRNNRNFCGWLYLFFLLLFFFFFFNGAGGGGGGAEFLSADILLTKISECVKNAEISVSNGVMLTQLIT